MKIDSLNDCRGSVWAWQQLWKLPDPIAKTKTKKKEQDVYTRVVTTGKSRILPYRSAGRG